MASSPFSQPRLYIAGVIVSRFEFRREAEVGAEEAASEFGDQFLAGPFGLVFGVATEVAIETLRRRSPVGFMPLSA